MKGLKHILLSVLSGVLLGLSWPYTGSLTPFIFIGLIPLLWVEDQLDQTKKNGRGKKVFGHAYLAFLTFNLVATWWIYHASLPGMIMAVIFNSLFMAVVFWLFHYSKRWLGNKAGYIALIIYWLSFEWVHFNWELSWIWLTYGNAFALHPKIIQWYEYTGVLGGSLWVLISNLLLFKAIKKYLSGEDLKKALMPLSLFALTVSVPIIISCFIYKGYEAKKDPVNVVVVQPNIDPYFDKFEGMSDVEQIQRFIGLAASKTTDSTDFVLGPETAVPGGYFESELDKFYVFNLLRNYVNAHPRIRMVIGLSSFKAYDTKEKPTPTARPFKQEPGYYDAYNSALQIDTSGNMDIYHKSKLVLGVERLPFSYLLSPLEDLALDLGGTTGSLGVQEKPSVFSTDQNAVLNEKGNGVSVAPVICYESVYGEYCTEYIKRGAELIFILTNDGWWDNTPGYKQHLAYASLRAIETRRSIARSANTGISCFLNQRGDILQATEWWEPAAIQRTIHANSEMTFYTLYGDYIGRIAGFFALLLVLWTIVKRLNKTEQRLNS